MGCELEGLAQWEEIERATELLAELITLLKDGTSKGQAGRRLTELSFVFAPTVKR